MKKFIQARVNGGSNYDSLKDCRPVYSGAFTSELLTFSMSVPFFPFALDNQVGIPLSVVTEDVTLLLHTE